MSYQTRFRKTRKTAKSSESFYPDVLKKLKKTSNGRRFKKIVPSKPCEEGPSTSTALAGNVPAPVRSSLFEKFQMIPEETPMDTTNSPVSSPVKSEMVDVRDFVEELLSGVKKKLETVSQMRPVGVKKSVPSMKQKQKRRSTYIDGLPKLGDRTTYDIKRMAEAYLDSFLEIISDEEDGREGREFHGSKLGSNDFEVFRNPIINFPIREPTKCWFTEALCEEGYFSRPMELTANCPWPSLDRCPLSSQVERKNGDIYVVKGQRRTHYEGDQEGRKRRKVYSYSHPPRYITPRDYHRRSLDHVAHLERSQLRNILYSQEYEQVYRSEDPRTIPGWVRDRPPFSLGAAGGETSTSNWQLIAHVDSRCSGFSGAQWETVARLAREGPLLDLPPALVDHFFYKRFLTYSSATDFNRRKKHNTRLMQSIKPELYIVPQLVTRHLVPKLPDLPRTSTAGGGSATPKTPELRNVENVYSFKRRGS